MNTSTEIIHISSLYYRDLISSATDDKDIKEYKDRLAFSCTCLAEVLEKDDGDPRKIADMYKDAIDSYRELLNIEITEEEKKEYEERLTSCMQKIHR